MNCEQFEQLIALQVEGDLPHSQQAKLSNHLSVCGSCHRFAEEIRDSQAALRGYTGEDFGERILADIRKSVMSQIHSGAISLSRWERFAGWLGVSDINRLIWAISGAAAVLVLTSTIAFYAFLKSGPNVEIIATAPTLNLPGSDPRANAFRKETPTTYVPVRRHVKRPPDMQDSMIASNSGPPLPSLPSFENVPGTTDLSTQLVASESSGSGSGSDSGAIPVTKKDVTRIEMQTANPNIRIIWFVDKKLNAPPVGVLSDGEETKF